MICEICNNYIGVSEVGDKVYVDLCRHCTKTTYRDGVKVGFQLAGGDPNKLDAIYDKEAFSE